MAACLLEPEVDADGREVGLLERLLGEPAEQRGLPDGAVADEHYLEEVVVLFNH